MLNLLNLWQIRRMAHFLLSSREWGRPQSCSEWCCPGIKVQLVECILPNASHPTSRIHAFRLIRTQVSSTTRPNSSSLIDWLNSCPSFLSTLLPFRCILCLFLVKLMQRLGVSYYIIDLCFRFLFVSTLPPKTIQLFNQDRSMRSKWLIAHMGLSWYDATSINVQRFGSLQKSFTDFICIYLSDTSNTLLCRLRQS